MSEDYSTVEMVGIAVAIIAIFGFIGYTYGTRTQAPTPSTTTTQTSSTTPTTTSVNTTASPTTSTTTQPTVNPYLSLPVSSTLNQLMNSFGGSSGYYFVTTAINTTNNAIFQGLLNGVYLLTSASSDFSNVYSTTNLATQSIYANSTGNGGQVVYNESFSNSIVPSSLPMNTGYNVPFYIMFVGTFNGVKYRSNIGTASV
jgi:hypothetical protein